MFEIEQKLNLKFPLYWSGAAIEPKFARMLIYKIAANKPAVVVEMGSGLSTIITAKIFDILGLNYQLYSFDADEATQKEVIGILESEGLYDKKKHHLIHAPITEINLDGNVYSYYDPNKIVLETETIDLLVIDGPVGASCKNARYPALPLLKKYLSKGSIVLLDDADRPDEKEIVEIWKKENPEISKVWNVDTDRGAVEIRF